MSKVKITTDTYEVNISENIKSRLQFEIVNKWILTQTTIIQTPVCNYARRTEYDRLSQQQLNSL